MLTLFDSSASVPLWHEFKVVNSEIVVEIQTTNVVFTK